MFSIIYVFIFRNIKKAEEKIKNFEKELQAADNAKISLNENRESTVSKARDFFLQQEAAQVYFCLYIFLYNLEIFIAFFFL